MKKKAKKQNPELTKSTVNKAFLTPGKTWTQILEDSSIYGGVKVDPGVIDEVLGKPQLGTSGKPTEWISYWQDTASRNEKSGADVTVGMITGYYDQKMKEKTTQRDWYDNEIAKLNQDNRGLKVGKKRVDEQSLDDLTSSLDYLSYAKSEKAKIESDITRLSIQKREFQTSKEVLAEAQAINTQAEARKEAKKVIKHYDPVGVNYLNPEGVEGYYRKYMDEEQLASQTVRATYTKFLSPTTSVYRTSKGTTIFDTSGGKYELAQQERQEVKEIARLHKGYYEIQGMDPDKPRTLMRWRRAVKSTDSYMPKMQEYIDERDTKLVELYAAKKKSNVQYSEHTNKIAKLAEKSADIYRQKGGSVSSSDFYDTNYLEELSLFARDRESLRYTIAKYEAERDMMKKNLSETEKQQETLKGQIKDVERSNLAHSGTGGFLRPNRFAPSGSSRYHAAVGSARIKQAGYATAPPVRRRGQGAQRRRTRSGLGGLVV